MASIWAGLNSMLASPSSWETIMKSMGIIIPALLLGGVVIYYFITSILPAIDGQAAFDKHRDELMAEMAQAVQDLQDNKITQQQYLALIDKEGTELSNWYDSHPFWADPPSWWPTQ